MSGYNTARERFAGDKQHSRDGVVVAASDARRSFSELDERKHENV